MNQNDIPELDPDNMFSDIAYTKHLQNVITSLSDDLKSSNNQLNEIEKIMTGFGIYRSPTDINDIVLHLFKSFVYAHDTTSFLCQEYEEVITEHHKKDNKYIGFNINDLLHGLKKNAEERAREIYKTKNKKDKK